MKTILKQLMIALLLLVSIEGYGQYVAIPDSNFGMWLNGAGFSSCLTSNGNDGNWQLDTTCSTLLNTRNLYLGAGASPSTSLDISGIGYFKNVDTLSLTTYTIHIVPSLPPSLKYLYTLSPIDSFSLFPTSLKTLNLFPASITNGSTYLAPLPDSLTILMIRGGGFYQLSSGFPTSLRYLYLNAILVGNSGTNSTTSLPSLLNTRLDTAYFQNAGYFTNTALLLPQTLKYFAGDNTYSSAWETIPYLPDSLTYFGCPNSNISRLPNIPASVTYLNGGNNPQLSCIQHISSAHLDYFSIGGTGIQCMPNRFAHPLIYDRNPDTLPLCTVPCPGPAGPDQTICQNTSATMAATGTGTWSAFSSNPVSTLIANSNSATTSVSGFTVAGTYGFVWANDTMIVTVNSAARVSISISPDTITTVGQPITLTANASPVGGTYQWAPLLGISPAGGNTGSITATLSGIGSVNYCVTYQTTQGCLNTSCQMIYVVNASAGPDQTIHIGDTATMAALGSGSWTALATNPTATTIANPSSTSAIITGFTQLGVYSYVWMSGGVSDTMTVTVTNIPNNYVLIPDTNFGTWLNTNGYVSCMTGNNHSGWYMDTTAPLVVDSNTNINCHYSRISDLTGIQYFKNLKTLFCDQNLLTAFPPLPEHLESLSCNSNLFVSISQLPNHLKILQCGGNLLTSIALPPSLKYLDCSSNQLSMLPTLPDSITDVYCSYNALTSLPLLPDSIHNLSCSWNLIASLPTLPRSLKTLACFGNHLTSLPSLPDSISSLSCYSNFISCLPLLPATLSYLAIDTSQIKCLSRTVTNLFDSAGAVTVSNPIWVYPICGIGNTNGCAVVPGSAGPDQIRCLHQLAFISDTFTMAAVGSGTWSVLPNNPHNNVIIDSPSSPHTIVYANPFMTGKYGFVWNSSGSFDTMYITVDSAQLITGVQTSLPVICSGMGDTFSVIPTFLGFSFSYAWYLNSNLVGGDSSTYIAPMLAQGDSVKVSITSPTGCVNYHLGSMEYSLPFRVDPLPVANAGHDTTICSGSCVTMGTAPIAGQTYWWSPSAVTTSYQTVCPVITATYTLHVAGGSGCIDSNSIIVTVINCSTDSVWPGDADNNRMVDNNDLLPIGLGYDSTGAARTVHSIVWQGDAAVDWANSFTNYTPSVNYKHADCNGDGTINANDTLAILTNFSLIHPKTNGYNGTWRSGIPSLTVRMSKDTVLNGDTLTIGVILGDSSLPVNNIYGLAFTFHYDPLVVDSNHSEFHFVNSWFGNNANSININRNQRPTGEVKAAITGINHTSRSGSGQIATCVCVITTGNVNGKDLSYYTNQVYISDITAIDQYGNPLQLNAGIDSNHVGYLPNGINDLNGMATVRIYPNPASHNLYIASDDMINAISISDIPGKNLLNLTISNKPSETIDISTLEAGIYIVHVSTSHGSISSKLIVSK